jgi:hypothetical protein
MIGPAISGCTGCTAIDLDAVDAAKLAERDRVAMFR